MSSQNDDQARILQVAVQKKTLATSPVGTKFAFKISAGGQNATALVYSPAESSSLWPVEDESPVHIPGLPAEGRYDLAVAVVETEHRGNYAVATVVDQNTGESVKDMPVVSVPDLMEEGIMVANALLHDLGIAPMDQLTPEQMKDPGVIRCMVKGTAIVLEDMYEGHLEADRDFLGTLSEQIAIAAISPNISIDLVLGYIGDQPDWVEPTDSSTASVAFVGPVHRPK